MCGGKYMCLYLVMLCYICIVNIQYYIELHVLRRIVSLLTAACAEQAKHCV